jgi:phage shock protein E
VPLGLFVPKRLSLRSPGEFNAGHLPGALNLPLGSLAEELPGRVLDKNQVVLLHHVSGTRSGLARRQLVLLGYRNVFNLGSYGRAERIVRGGKNQGSTKLSP